jgi:hypothetical protein
MAVSSAFTFLAFAFAFAFAAPVLAGFLAFAGLLSFFAGAGAGLAGRIRLLDDLGGFVISMLLVYLTVPMACRSGLR